MPDAAPRGGLLLCIYVVTMLILYEYILKISYRTKIFLVPCMPKYGLKYGLWSEMAAFMQLSSGVRIALTQPTDNKIILGHDTRKV